MIVKKTAKRTKVTKPNAKRHAGRARPRAPETRPRKVAPAKRRSSKARPAVRESAVADAQAVETTSPPQIETPTADAVVLATPEPSFASRVAPPQTERPHPAARRAIFYDVENASRPEHIARVIDHLAVDRMGQRTDFVAVGNW